MPLKLNRHVRLVLAWVSVPSTLGILQALLTARHLQALIPSALYLVIKPAALAAMGGPGSMLTVEIPMATGAGSDAYAAPSMPERQSFWNGIDCTVV